jgi:hypothetical protein
MLRAKFWPITAKPYKPISEDILTGVEWTAAYYSRIGLTRIPKEQNLWLWLVVKNREQIRYLRVFKEKHEIS